MNRHFAALGDVWKHLTLAEILRSRPPKYYWETHAGSASYALTESPTRIHGALRFLTRAPENPVLAKCNYLKLLRNDPVQYPGSSILAVRTLGNGTKYVLCDTDRESTDSLRNATVGLSASIIETDGVAAISEAAKHTNAGTADIFIHIDPFDPHERVSLEARTTIELAGDLANAGSRLFYWYGYDSLDERGWALKEIRTLAPNVELWCGDILIPASFVYPGKTGAWGCGIVLANMTREEAAICASLGKALEEIYADDLLHGNDPSALEFAVING